MDLEAIIIKTGQLCHQYYNSELWKYCQLVMKVGFHCALQLSVSLLCQ